MKAIVSALTFALVFSGCTGEYGERRPMTQAEKGALIGAASGAVLGTLAKNRKKGVLIGAVGGGIAGGLVGTYMDNQRKDLEKVLTSERDAGAISIDKMPNNVLRVTMTNQTAFAFDSAQIQPGFHTTLDKIADVVNRYGKTHLTIVGHTDSTGAAEYNQKLSERRADAVQQYLRGHNVIAERLAFVGKGEAEPRASNDSTTGRQLNRRAEIYIDPIVADKG